MARARALLLGIAAGVVAADEGRIAIMGNPPLIAADPLQARRLGLAVVYQDDSLVRELSVAENLLLGTVDGPQASLESGSGRRSSLRHMASGSGRSLLGHCWRRMRQFLENRQGAGG